MNKSFFALVGFVAIGAAANAHAQSGYYDLPPRGPVYVQPYGGPLVPAHDVETIVRSIGLEPLAPPVRRLANYVVWATDRDGMRVRVLIDARYGDVLAVRPSLTGRRSADAVRYSGSPNRANGADRSRPSYRAKPRLDTRVPLPRSRTAFAAPVPRPRPAEQGAAPAGALAPVPVSLPAKSNTDGVSATDGKVPDVVAPPAKGSNRKPEELNPPDEKKTGLPGGDLEKPTAVQPVAPDGVETAKVDATTRATEDVARPEGENGTASADNASRADVAPPAKAASDAVGGAPVEMPATVHDAK